VTEQCKSTDADHYLLARHGRRRFKARPPCPVGHPSIRSIHSQSAVFYGFDRTYTTSFTGSADREMSLPPFRRCCVDAWHHVGQRSEEIVPPRRKQCHFVRTLCAFVRRFRLRPFSTRISFSAIIKGSIAHNSILFFFLCFLEMISLYQVAYNFSVISRLIVGLISIRR